MVQRWSCWFLKARSDYVFPGKSYHDRRRDARQLFYRQSDEHKRAFILHVYFPDEFPLPPLDTMKLPCQDVKRSPLCLTDVPAELEKKKFIEVDEDENPENQRSLSHMITHNFVTPNGPPPDVEACIVGGLKGHCLENALMVYATVTKLWGEYTSFVKERIKGLNGVKYSVKIGLSQG